jgi:hypothetical protein
MMKQWRINALVDGKEETVMVRRHYKDGIPLTNQEALREYVLPHVKRSRAKIEIISVEELSV